jgi:REP element-mobilizing transposase RayT
VTVLTGIGEVVNKCWREIPQHFPGVEIESYIVMPNHLHGIFGIAAKFSNGLSQASLVQTAESLRQACGQIRPNNNPFIQGGSDQACAGIWLAR